MSTIEEFTVPLRSTNIQDQALKPISVEQKLQYLMTIVKRIKELSNVEVKTVPYRTQAGDIFHIPGAWSITLKSSSHSDDENDEETMRRMSGRGYRVTDGESDDEDGNDTDTESDGLGERRSSTSSSDRFVVRNEFGHARIQQLIRYLETRPDASASRSPPVSAPVHNHHSQPPSDVTAVGGHCTLPPAVFDLCIAQGWGWPHPFGGQYHPITGTVIPATTLLYPTPRSDAELEIVWQIVSVSYEWAKAAALESDAETTTTMTVSPMHASSSSSVHV